MIKRSFYLLWGSQTISNVADIIYLMTVISFVFGNTHSLLSTVIVPLMRYLSQIVSGLVFPLVVSKFRLVKILVFAQLAQFSIFSCLMIYYFLTESIPLAILFLLIFCISFFDGWVKPCRNSIIPRLATKEALIKVNGLVSTTDQIIKCSSWAFSGVLVIMLGTFNSMIIVLVSLFIATILASLIKDNSEQDKSHHKKSKWTQAVEGWKASFKDKRIRTVFIVDAIDTIGGTAWIGAFVLAFCVQVLQKDESWWGLANGSFFAGSIIGGLLVVSVSNYFNNKKFPLMLWGLAIYAAIAGAFAFNGSPFVAIALMFIMGPPLQVTAVIRRTLLQENAEKDKLPKVMACLEVTNNVVFSVSLLSLGWVADTFGIQTIYAIAAMVTLGSVLIGIFARSNFTEQKVKSFQGETVRY
ncbi:MFS transporter [Paenibacillus oleatilyticus]|uniref:MFS transporter n=1 Tax=Paenibacillus oleatilyticus TaxID=2594886 RepID=UPI0020A823F6|nr:MFS transporter [Paenibacillus oleatilyticus]